MNLQSFQPFSPQRPSPQQSQAGSHAADNPFSNPRLLESTPPRHSSPYDVARGVHGASNAAFLQAQAERDSHGAAAAAAAAGDTDALLASLLRGDEELKRLSLGAAQPAAPASQGFSPRHQQQQQLQQSSLSSSFAAASYSSPARASSSATFSGSVASPSVSAAADQLYYNLLKSAREGDCAAVKQLLQSSSASAGAGGLDVNYTDRDGDSALHRACAGAHLDMVHLLVLEGRANVHLANNSGDTPLLVNVKSASPHPRLIRFLIECGSDIYQKNNSGLNVVSCVAARPAVSQGPSAFGALASSSASADLSQLVLDAHANPVRLHLLNQLQELKRCQTQLDATAIQLAAQEQDRVAMESQLATQAAQLRSCHAALVLGSNRMHAMDAELERVARKQMDDQQSQQLPPTPPQVLISEIRAALASVNQSFRPV